jgi:hypothetical protein
MIKRICKFTEEALFKAWWVISFMLFCYLLYERGLSKRNHDFAKLHSKYLELHNEYKLALLLQDNLLLQVNSQSDPEWAELTLMKGLGLVPDGQTKVLFVEKQ